MIFIPCILFAANAGPLRIIILTFFSSPSHFIFVVAPSARMCSFLSLSFAHFIPLSPIHLINHRAAVACYFHYALFHPSRPPKKYIVFIFAVSILIYNFMHALALARVYSVNTYIITWTNICIQIFLNRYLSARPDLSPLFSHSVNVRAFFVPLDNASDFKHRPYMYGCA